MAETIKLLPTEIHTIPIKLVNAADGTTLPIPAGDTFTAVQPTPNPAISAVVNPTGAPDGGPALVVNALTPPSPSGQTMGLVVNITDSNNDVQDTMTVNYAPLPIVGDIVADVANDVVTAQPAPTGAAPA